MESSKEETFISTLCNRLQLPNSVKYAAEKLLAALYRSAVVECEKSLWTVCSIYVSVINTSVSEFFKTMKTMKEQFTLCDAVLQHLLQVERKYLISCPLYYKLIKMFDEIFAKNVLLTDGDALGCGDDGFHERFKFCWTLFVYTKSAARGDRGGRNELIFSFHLLLCCIQYVIRLTPSFQLKPPFDNVRISAGVPNDDAMILSKICEIFKGSFEEARLIEATYIRPVIDALPQKHGVIDVDRVSADYVARYREAGDINELDFLTDSATYLVIPTLPAQWKSCPSACDVATVSAPTLTPVRPAVNSVQQLTRLLQQLPDGPSPELTVYLQKCEVDPLPAMSDRLLMLGQMFVSQFMSTTGDQLDKIARARCSLATRLYHRTLLSLLQMEVERLGEQDFSRLLHKPIFHRCLFACCVEVVLLTFESHVHSNIRSPVGAQTDSSNVLFPWILSTFELKAIDFFKVLESFIRAETNLSVEIVQHLRMIETRILEQLAWQHDSPLFELLPSYRGPAATVSTSTTSTPTKATELTLARPEFAGSPAKSTLTSSLESPTVSPRRSASLDQFLNRVFKHAFQRLQSLCTLLHISADLQHKIWMCVEYCIVQRSVLLHGRHLDQIIMCCIYAVCKVVDQETKFKTIVSLYRQLPHTSQQVYKLVLIANDEFDSIISFYNRVFMQSVKSFVMQFAVSRSPVKSMSPAAVNSPKLVTCLPGWKNITVSPMDKSPFKPPMSPSHLTPRSRQLFSFGDSSDKLRQINERLRASAPVSRSAKCFKFDQTDSPGVTELDANVTKHKTPSSRKSLQFDAPTTTSAAE